MIANIQDTAFKALATAFFANQFHVGEELHLDRNSTVSLAGFAAPTGNVEGKMTSGEAAPLSVWSFGEDFSEASNALT